MKIGWQIEFSQTLLRSTWEDNFRPEEVFSHSSERSSGIKIYKTKKVIVVVVVMIIISTCSISSNASPSAHKMAIKMSCVRLSIVRLSISWGGGGGLWTDNLWRFDGNLCQSEADAYLACYLSNWESCEWKFTYPCDKNRWHICINKNISLKLLIGRFRNSSRN